MKTRLVVLLAALIPVSSGGPARAQTPDFKYFFTATDQSFEAYMDKANVGKDSEGDTLISVKLTKFSASFRKWIRDNFPDGETADYAIDSYSIDCDKKTVGEHRIVWYDTAGSELTDYDFGGHMSTPVAYSMKENLMKKLCGF